MNLKFFYDDVVKCNAKLGEVTAQMEELYKAGDKASALELKPELDKAKDELKVANEVYVSLVEGAQETGVARNFIPVSDEAVAVEKGDEKVVARFEFDKMTAAEKVAFVVAGGKITE
jgi:hypothetical protein